MNILIRFLAMHDDLADQSKKLWEDYALRFGFGVEFVPSEHYAFLAQYNSCISNADIVIQFDEDCFIMHPERFMGMANYMIKNKIAYAGMREIDSNVRKDVQGVKDYFINSFFMMVQPKLITLPEPMDLVGFEPSNGAWLEPYWNIIGYMHSRGLKCKYLTCKPHYDGISTILNDFQGNPLCIHTWFARLWDCSESVQVDEGVPHNRARIEDAFKYASKENMWQFK